MNNHNKLHKRILAYALIPSMIVSILVIASFAYLQNRQIGALEHEKFVLAEHIASVQGRSLQDPQEFERLARTLLAIDPLHRVSLFSSTEQLLATEGLPDLMSGWDRPLPFDDQTRQWNENHTHYALVPIVPVPEQPVAYWLLLEMDTTPFSLLRHQVFISLLLLGLAALAACAYCAKRLQSYIVAPLQQLTTGLESYLKGSAENPVLVGGDSTFQELADAIGELAKKQRLEQDEMQSYLEEYTQELRETLETVEIQNIELDMARKNAIESSRAKSEFLANASHELRTPLNGILGFASLLLKTDLTDQQTDYLSTIEHSAQGLLTIINDILDISRLETGNLILEYKPVPIYQTIEEILKMHAPGAHEKKLRLVTLVDPHVPENLLGDPQRLKQVIANLVSNAIKFSNKGNIVIRVNFMGETDNQVHLKFAISDSGSGLTPEQQEGLFDSYSQTDTADNRLHGGTGLGLAIARGLVNRMHGEIGVESEAGRGSTFWFTARLGINSRQPSSNKQNNTLGQTRALVYDSNTVSRSEITHLLGNWGASYVETGHFEEITSLAAEHAKGSPVQIAILDSEITDNLFDRQQLRNCIEYLNSELHIPVIVLAPPNICRMLEPTLEKLQAVAMSRPLSHYQLHRVICSQLGISLALPEPMDYPPSRVRLEKPVAILAVDDNAANLRLVSELLKGLGAQVETAGSGEEALARCAEKKFDLILMDIQMPGMDGLETTRKLRAQEPPGQRVPVVALTAHAVNEQKTRLLLAGMDDYLSKPVNDLELRHIVERWVNSSRSFVAEPEPGNYVTREVADSRSTFNLTEALERARNKHDLAKDMMNMLLASLDEAAENMAMAIEADDMARLQEIAHKLYGSCCYCGVPALREAAGNLQELLQKKEYEAASNTARVVLARIAELQDWAEQQDFDVLFE